MTSPNSTGLTDEEIAAIRDSISWHRPMAMRAIKALLGHVAYQGSELTRLRQKLKDAERERDEAEDCIRRAHDAADAAGEPVAPYTDQADLAQFIEASMECWGILHEREHAMYLRDNKAREARAAIASMSQKTGGEG